MVTAFLPTKWFLLIGYAIAKWIFTTPLAIYRTVKSYSYCTSHYDLLDVLLNLTNMSKRIIGFLPRCNSTYLGHFYSFDVYFQQWSCHLDDDYVLFKVKTHYYVLPICSLFTFPSFMWLRLKSFYDISPGTQNCF